jgi:tetratricopeptide (TPR) repeat protein
MVSYLLTNNGFFMKKIFKNKYYVLTAILLMMVIMTVVLLLGKAYFNNNQPASIKNELGAIAKEIRHPGQMDELEKKTREWETKAKGYVQKKQYDKAIECYKAAIKELKPLWGNNNTIEASLNMQIALMYMKKKDYNKVIEVYKQVSESYRTSLGYVLKPAAYTQVQLNIAHILYNQDKLSEALEELNKVKQEIPEMEKLKREDYLIRYYYLQGMINGCLKEYSIGIKNAKKCIALIGTNYTQTNKQYLTESYCNMSNSLKSLDRIKEVQTYTKKCFDICKKNYSNDKATMGMQYYNYGMVLFDLDKNEKAQVYFDKAIALLSHAKNSKPFYLGLAYFMQGRCLADQKKWKKALVAFEKAIAQIKPIALRDREPFVYKNLYNSYRWLFWCSIETEEYSRGINQFEKAESLLENGPQTEELAGVYSGVSFECYFTGKYNKAEKYYNSALKFSQSLPKTKDLITIISALNWCKAQTCHKKGHLTEAIRYGNVVIKSGISHPKVLKTVNKWKNERKNIMIK